MQAKKNVVQRKKLFLSDFPKFRSKNLYFCVKEYDQSFCASVMKIVDYFKNEQTYFYRYYWTF